MRSHLVTGILFGFLFLAMGVPCAPAANGDAYQFFYEGWDTNGNSQIYRCDYSGLGEVKLFNDSYSRHRPSLSPDGTRIAYVRNEPGLSLVCTADINGNDERLLVPSTAEYGFACANWHPDGTNLIFVERSNNTIRNGDVFRAGTNGEDRVNLTQSTDYDKHYAHYKSDGSTFCFSRNETGWYAFPQNLFLRDADGSNERKLTYHGNGEMLKVFACRYAPEGNQIVYQQGTPSHGNPTIWMVDDNGSNNTQIVDSTFANEGPAFLADGYGIVFSRHTDGRWQLQTAELDGSYPYVVPQPPGIDRRFPVHGYAYGLIAPPAEARLQCFLEPGKALYEGARWGVYYGEESTTWYESGEVSDVLDLEQGPYSLIFEYLPDWVEPPGQYDLYLAEGQTTVFSVRYYPADMQYIEGGTFEMGLYRGQGGHTVTLDDFYLTDDEITVGDFMEFVDHTGAPMPPAPPWGWSGTNLPIVNLTWNEAAAYAAWAGNRLPTEAEFEYAMRGGEASWTYPWGDTISSEDANYNNNIGQPTEAGTFDQNAYGLYDIGGNVWEWCSDWFASVLPPTSTNPTGPESGITKAVRSGSWVNSAMRLRCAPRFQMDPAVRYIDVGFRCAMDVIPFQQQAASLPPDWWVMLHYGLDVNTADRFEAGGDSDGDGLGNGAEFVARTDPNNATSVLRATDVAAGPNGQFVLQWSSSAGCLYAVERSAAPGHGFKPVAGGIPATPPLNAYTDTPPDTVKAWFYRIRVE